MVVFDGWCVSSAPVALRHEIGTGVRKWWRHGELLLCCRSLGSTCSPDTRRRYSDMSLIVFFLSRLLLRNRFITGVLSFPPNWIFFHPLLFSLSFLFSNRSGTRFKSSESEVESTDPVLRYDSWKKWFRLSISCYRSISWSDLYGLTL